MNNPYFDFLDKFASEIKKRRGGMSQRSFARQIGISHASVSRIEKGYPFDLETLFKILLAYKVDLNLILDLKALNQKTYTKHWETIQAGLARLRVPKGWLIYDSDVQSVLYVPDPDNEWILEGDNLESIDNDKNNKKTNL